MVLPVVVVPVLFWVGAWLQFLVRSTRRRYFFAASAGQRKSRLATRPGTDVTTRSGRIAAASRLAAPPARPAAPVRSIRPRTTRAGAVTAAGRWRSHTGGGQM